MERFKLREARGNRPLREIADALGCSEDSLNNWERGATNPQWHWRNKLCVFYGKEPFDLDLEIASQSREDEIVMLQKKLEGLNLSRREMLDIFSSLPAFAGLDLSVLLGLSSLVAPEEFLDQCNAGINACWHLLKHDGLAYADNILSSCIPKLSDMATHESSYQEIAVSLAAEAKIQQVILSTHKLDYRAREIHSLGAVRFGKLSGDACILAVAISWQADMCTSSWNRQPQPKKAISLFKEGLSGLDDGALLNKADLSIGLAKAYALDGNETSARDLIEQAKMVMPRYPEQDSLYRIIETGQSELDQQEGRIYLELNRIFPGRGYAQIAYDTFDRSAGKQVTSDRVQSNLLIHKAGAACAIGDFDHFIGCLASGLDIAFQIDSKKRQAEGRRILGNVPESWKKEAKYQELVKMF